MAKDATLTFRLRERDLKELRELAQQEDETVSFFVQQAVKEFLERWKRRAQKQ